MGLGDHLQLGSPNKMQIVCSFSRSSRAEDEESLLLFRREQGLSYFSNHRTKHLCSENISAPILWYFLLLCLPLIFYQIFFLKKLYLAAEGLSCGMWIFIASRGSFIACMDSVVVGLVLPKHVGSSWTRDGPFIPCIARRILKHWTTSESESRSVGSVVSDSFRPHGLQSPWDSPVLNT